MLRSISVLAAVLSISAISPAAAQKRHGGHAMPAFKPMTQVRAPAAIPGARSYHSANPPRAFIAQIGRSQAPAMASRFTPPRIIHAAAPQVFAQRAMPMRAQPLFAPQQARVRQRGQATFLADSGFAAPAPQIVYGGGTQTYAARGLPLPAARSYAPEGYYGGAPRAYYGTTQGYYAAPPGPAYHGGYGSPAAYNVPPAYCPPVAQPQIIRIADRHHGGHAEPPLDWNTEPDLRELRRGRVLYRKY